MKKKYLYVGLCGIIVALLVAYKIQLSRHSNEHANGAKRAEIAKKKATQRSESSSPGPVGGPVEEKAAITEANWSHAETHARSHGRNERCQTIVCHYLGWMDADIRGAWTGLETLIVVSRDRDHGGP